MDLTARRAPQRGRLVHAARDGLPGKLRWLRRRSFANPLGRSAKSLMTRTPEIGVFARRYSAASRERIAFAWNGNHGSEFADPNAEFRDAAIAFALENPEDVPVSLIRDLFLETAAFAREAWAVPESFATLAGLLLTRGRASVLPDFLLGASRSFDTVIACHAVTVPPDVATELHDALMAQEFTPYSRNLRESLVKRFRRLATESDGGAA